MKPILPIVVLGLLAILVANDAASQPTATSRPPTPAEPRPPGVQRLDIKPETPDERAAFLARRRAEMEKQQIETVTPLPAQRPAPPPPSEPQQR